jgi:antitoxin HigA-1
LDLHYKLVDEDLRTYIAEKCLQKSFLMLLSICAHKLAKDVGIPQTRVSEILKGSRRITADAALRLSKYFGTSAKFRLGFQEDFDLEERPMQKVI